MKKLLFFLLFLSLGYSVFSQNTVTSQNTWYKINSKGTFLTKIKASGPYAEHEVVASIINNYWNTVEVHYLSEFNYDHARIKLEWGYIGSGANMFAAVRIVPISADYASGFELTDVLNPTFDYGLVAVDSSLVTPILPKNQLFVDEWTGNIGIGTSSPLFKLDVNGDLNTGSLLFGNENHGVIRGGSDIYGNDVTVYTGAGSVNFATLGPPYGKPSLDKIKMRITNNGNVGIGTTTPDSKLTVAGNIHAQEVKVTVNAGADFVFNDDYILPSLKSVEKFIKENRHLPDIASEKEMQDNGLFLANMNIKLLQKIEELTLYTIQQEKKLESQENQIKEQSKNNTDLNNRLLKLEQLLSNQQQVTNN